MRKLKNAMTVAATAAVIFLGTASVGRADIPSWFWPILFDWADGLTADVDALEARVIALEAENEGFNSGDLTGYTYCFYGNGRELTGGGAPGVYRSAYIGALSFTSSSAGTFLVVRDADAFLNTSTGAISGAVSLPFSVDNLTYVASGSSITISIIGEDDFLFHVSPDGNVMFGAASDFGDSNHDFDAIMAIRGDTC